MSAAQKLIIASYIMLLIPKPTSEIYLSHYAPEGDFVTLTPIYNIVPLRNCPLNSQPSDMKIHFYLHSVVHGENMKMNTRGNLFILKYTFQKWSSLNDHCSLGVNNSSLYYWERFSHLKCLVCQLLPRWNIGLLIRFDIESEAVWPLVFIFNSSHNFFKCIS